MDISWKHYDTGLFAVELPADWTAEDRASGLVLLRDPEQRLSVMLSVLPKSPARRTPWVERRSTTRAISPQEAKDELAHWIGKQKQVRVRQSPHVISGTTHLTCTTEGWEYLRAGVSWLKWLLCRGPLLIWRFWAVLNGHMLVLASCNGQPEVIEQFRPTVDRIIGSLHLPERDLLVGREFSEAVASLARGYFPRTAVALIDERHLKFGARHVDLMALHRRYLEAPEQLSNHVRTFFMEVQRLQDLSNGSQEWDQVRAHIMPCLVQEARLGRFGPDCVTEEWVNELCIVYVVDEAGTYRSVTRAEARAWVVETDELHEQALTNLVLRSQELTMEGSRADGYTMLALTTTDPYNAARILLPDLHRKLREHLGPIFYVGIPSREFLVAFNTSNEEVLERVRRQMAHDYERTDDPVSPKLFQVTPDGIAGDPYEASVDE